MKKKLSELLQTVPDSQIFGDVTTEVNTVTDDSRKIEKGGLFVAIKGLKVDAHKFIPEVIKSGAKVVVGEDEPEKEWLKKVVYVKVGNSRQALALIASQWYDNPSRKLKVIGVTGTKGKTTVAFLTYWFLKSGGKKTGLVSSINAIIGEKEFDTGFHVTNPEPMALQKFLSEMVNEGCEYAVLEVTSHGLDQNRVAGVDFEVAVLTNITHEHLDYHKTYENYRDAKAKLFKNVKIAVINSDDKSFEYIKSIIPGYTEVITYACKNPADYNLQNIKITDSMIFEIVTGLDKLKIETKYLGIYNALNTAAAFIVARRMGVDDKKLIKAIDKAPQLPGHLEKVENKKDIEIYIDFAHTPDSLEQVLTLLKGKTKGKLISVFGCASERDTLKRPMMGEISAKLANVSIFTAEDPRNEDVNNIISETVKGAKKTKAKEINMKHYSDIVHDSKHIFFRIAERGEAITFAINNLAGKGDTVVICGKGHEKSMAYNGVEYPWSDQEAVDLALKGEVYEIIRSDNKKKVKK